LSSGDSHFILTNQPKGKRFKVYSVQLLSRQKVKILGGIQIQNSKTFTQLFFAAIKCQNSWIKTKNKKSKIQIIIANTIFFVFIKINLFIKKFFVNKL
jgi:hypothetical protein